MRVLKFGGTSVGSPERMKSLLEILDFDQGSIVVLSAIAGVTNRMEAIYEAARLKQYELVKQQCEALHSDYQTFIKQLLNKEELQENAFRFIEDHMSDLERNVKEVSQINSREIIMTMGELVSTYFFHLLLLENGVSSALIPALHFMVLNDQDEPDVERIRRLLQRDLEQNKRGKIFITQGFICRNSQGMIATLDRGGSDYTATIVGSAIHADEVQIWTDISGMHNNDPRIVEGTSPVTQLSFNEASELAYFGAKILHPSCILPAMKAGIPVRLKNTMDPTAKGTLIHHQTTSDDVKAIAAKDGITAIKIKSDRMLLAYGFLRRIFEIFESYKTPIDMITTSEVAVSVTIDNPGNLESIVKELEEHATVEVDDNLTIVCVVGDFIAEHKGYGARIFSSLEDVPVRMISYGGSQNNISILVRTADKSHALNSLHTLFN